MRNTDVKNMAQIPNPGGKVLTYAGSLKTTLTSPSPPDASPLTFSPAMISSPVISLNIIIPILWSLAQNSPLPRSQSRSSHQGVIILPLNLNGTGPGLSILDYNFYKHDLAPPSLQIMNLSRSRSRSDSFLYFPKLHDTLQTSYHKLVPQYICLYCYFLSLIEVSREIKKFGLLFLLF